MSRTKVKVTVGDPSRFKRGGALPPRCVVRALAVIPLLLPCLVASSALAAGDANMPSCSPATESSPGFRASLPDCRAFELVSPAYGAGALAKGPFRDAPPISSNGEELLAEDFGDFAETEELANQGFEYGEQYRFWRSATSWLAEPQDPPASLYPAHSLAKRALVASDLGRSLWTVPAPAPFGQEPERVWVRRNSGIWVLREARGDFATVGPVTGPNHETTGFGAGLGTDEVEGVSSNLDHIVFAPRAGYKQLWPGDETLESDVVERKSLYEYHGTSGGEPVLVGVKNEGAAPWSVGSDRVNEGANLESDCGTGYEGMSSSGDRVFFTAVHEEGCPAKQPPVTELYARVEGASTVDLSEPSREDCASCVTDGPRSAALFEGSSEDGSKVFFASEQKLFGGANGEQRMNLYEYDFNGTSGARVTFIAPDVITVPSRNFTTRENQHSAVVARDGSRVYFQSADELTDTPNGDGETAKEGSESDDTVFLYAYDTASGVKTFVAAAKEVPEPEPFNANLERQPFKSLDTTRDGGYLAFETATDLGSDDTSTVPQVFEYEASSGALVRVSRGERGPGGFFCAATGTVLEGYNCDGNTSTGADAARIVAGAVNSVAENGVVVFTSALALAPGAIENRNVGPQGAEGVENVYEYRAGQVYLISPDDEPTPVHFINAHVQTRLYGVSEAGTDIFFVSGDSLVPQDTDTQASWYDARVDGGFPAPATTPGCDGEACQGVSAQPPLLATPRSSAPAAAGNLAPPPPTPASKTGAEIKAEKRAAALRACRKRRDRRKRIICERHARVEYRTATKAAHATAGTR